MPGDGHALLFARRQARWGSCHAFRRPTLSSSASAWAMVSSQAAAHHHGRFDEVLQHRGVREQVEVLEHHTGLAADAAHFGLADDTCVMASVCDQGLAFDGDEAPGRWFPGGSGSAGRCSCPSPKARSAPPLRPLPTVSETFAQHGRTPLKVLWMPHCLDHGLAGGSGACALIRRA